MRRATEPVRSRRAGAPEHLRIPPRSQLGREPTSGCPVRREQKTAWARADYVERAVAGKQVATPVAVVAYLGAPAAGEAAEVEARVAMASQVKVAAARVSVASSPEVDEVVAAEEAAATKAVEPAVDEQVADMQAATVAGRIAVSMVQGSARARGRSRHPRTARSPARGRASTVEADGVTSQHPRRPRVPQRAPSAKHIRRRRG